MTAVSVESEFGSVPPIQHVSPWDVSDVHVQPGDLHQLSRILSVASAAQQRAAEATDEQRAEWVLNLLDLIDERNEEFATAVSHDTGRLPASCRQEVIGTLRAMRILTTLWLTRSPEMWKTPTGTATVRDRPRGLALAITPGNFPVSAALRKSVAAVLAGCAVVLKPSERAPRTTVLLLAALRRSPAPIFVVRGGGEEAEALVGSGRFTAISFTGSTENGRRVAAAAPRLNTEVQIEAGGKNFCIIDDDIPLDTVLPRVIEDAWKDAGQNCVATNRLIVVTRRSSSTCAKIHRLVEEEVAKREPALFGALMSRGAVTRAERALSEAAAAGVKVTHYGTLTLPPEADVTAFVRPAIAWNPPATTAVWREDLFAPVLTVTTVESFDSAMHTANDSQFALAGSVFSGSAVHLTQARQHLPVGKLVLNAPTRTGAAWVPMTGFKDSGTGAPENGIAGILFFTRPQAVYDANPLPRTTSLKEMQ